ncbi:MAG: DNA polymerase III subunit delta' [Methylosarcina sp.]
MNSILPWQQRNWRHLCEYKSQNRIPQALLITGNKGLGKRLLAEQFAFSLLCPEPNALGLCCGQCDSCLLIKAGSHPDLFRIEPPEAGKAIGIDSIRTIIADTQLKPQYDTYRVVLIDPADRMNPAAANAFLKCLEEPGERTVILMITEKPAKLPATILSRCQKLAIPTPDKETVCTWLKEQNVGTNLEIVIAMAQNSPLLAKQYAEAHTLSLRNECFHSWVSIAKQQANPIMVAETWLKLPQHELLFWLCTWMSDLIKCRYQTKPDNFYNPDLIASLQELARRLDLKGLYRLYDLLLASRQWLDTQVNKQLMLEEILILWSQLNRSN